MSTPPRLPAGSSAVGQATPDAAGDAGPLPGNEYPTLHADAIDALEGGARRRWGRSAPPSERTWPHEVTGPGASSASTEPPPPAAAPKGKGLLSAGGGKGSRTFAQGLRPPQNIDNGNWTDQQVPDRYPERCSWCRNVLHQRHFYSWDCWRHTTDIDRATLSRVWQDPQGDWWTITCTNCAGKGNGGITIHYKRTWKSP